MNTTRTLAILLAIAGMASTLSQDDYDTVLSALETHLRGDGANLPKAVRLGQSITDTTKIMFLQ